MVKNVYFCTMLQFEKQKIKHIVRKALPVIALVAILYSCASIGRPEGGPKDYDPPRFVGSTPAAGAINNKRTKVSLQFDEFIKLEKASTFPALRTVSAGVRRSRAPASSPST